MIKRQISLKTLSQNLFLADYFDDLESERFVEGVLYCFANLKFCYYAKRRKSTESVLGLSMNAHSLLEQHYEEFLNELAKHVDQEFLEQDEKN